MVHAEYVFPDHLKSHSFGSYTRLEVYSFSPHRILHTGVTFYSKPEKLTPLFLGNNKLVLYAILDPELMRPTMYFKDVIKIPNSIDFIG